MRRLLLTVLLAAWCPINISAQDIANAHKIAGVMANGVWMAKSEIDQKLPAIAATHKAK
ncbi:MAG: hypothetical protein M3R55_08705 [Acidobacteriota bacterium]|nr:hypothetical protein [Acidobacteriota bacterium]